MGTSAKLSFLRCPRFTTAPSIYFRFFTSIIKRTPSQIRWRAQGESEDALVGL